MKRFSTAYLLLGILCSAAVFLIGAPSRALGAEVEHYEPLQVHVQLEKVYLDGDVSIEHKHEKVFSMDDFWVAYAGWTLVEQKRDMCSSGSKWTIYLRSARSTGISVYRIME